MSNIVVIPFFWYHDTSKETSRSLFTFFLKHFQIWKDEVDKVIVIDSGDFLETTEEKIELVKKQRQSHWQNLNEVLGSIDGEKFILLDSDTVIYRKGVLNDIFTDLSDYDVVSIMDNSGGRRLEDQFDACKANVLRSYRRRFAPYLFGCRVDFWKRLNNPDFTPTTGEEWTDSMGVITQDILSLHPRLKELPDDRTTVYWNDGDMQVSQWLDGNEFEWSKRVNPDYGYYHLRNMGGALYMIESFIAQNDRWKTIEDITPQNELLRLLTWAQVVTGSRISYVPMNYIGLHAGTYPWIKEIA